MKFYYRKDDGVVKMVSASLIDYDHNILDVVDINDNEYEGYSMTYTNNQLVKHKI